MKKLLTTLFVASALFAVGQNTDKRTLNDAYDSWGEGEGRTINIDAGPFEILGEEQTILLQVKDTINGFSSSWMQVFGNGSIRTGVYTDLTGYGFTDGRSYPYVKMPLGSFVSETNNQITDNTGNPMYSSSMVSGVSNTINNSGSSFITGTDNIISGGTQNAIIASASSRIGSGHTTNSAIIASGYCTLDSAVSFIAASYMCSAEQDHAVILSGYRAYAKYYHQVMIGCQPVVDTIGFNDDRSWQLNNKTFVIGNGGVDDPNPIRMTNSVTQIANGNILFGTHWRDIYDDLDTNSAIMTVMNDSVGGDMIFAAVNKNRDTTLTVSENSLKYVDGNQAAGAFLLSDASGNAHWTNIGQSPLTAKNDTTGLEREMSALPIALATIESLMTRVTELEAKLTAAGILLK